MADSSWIRIGAIDTHLDARTVNSIIEEALRKRAISITQRPELRQEIGQAYVDAVTPFVPMKSGQLRDSGMATDDGRVYWTAVNKGFNYAATVYDYDGEMWPDGEYAKPSTPGTYPRWVEKVQPGTAEYDAFINTITPIIIRGFADDE
jgi:hypothetical protein